MNIRHECLLLCAPGSPVRSPLRSAALKAAL
jgi:hypothetical protein